MQHWWQPAQQALHTLWDTSFPEDWRQFVVGSLCFHYGRLPSLWLQVRRWVSGWAYIHFTWVHIWCWTSKDNITSVCHQEIKSVVKNRYNYLRRCYASIVYWFLGLNWCFNEVLCSSMQMAIYIVSHCPWHSWHCIMLNVVMFYTKRIMSYNYQTFSMTYLHSLEK